MYIAVGIAAAFAALFVWWRFFYFFRDPQRQPPPGKNLLAPADGRVVYIKQVDGDMMPMSVKKESTIPLTELTKIDVLSGIDKFLIGIFMRPLDVHVNRASIAGEVKEIYYHRAKNLPMTRMWMRSIFGLRPYEKHSRHITENERNTVVLEGDFPVAIVQIADKYVKKIVCYLTKGQKIAKGERIGMIRMGSQVDCVFPRAGMTIQVEVGQMVKAGETVLATYE